jgi:hypothetical protein
VHRRHIRALTVVLLLLVSLLDHRPALAGRPDPDDAVGAAVNATFTHPFEYVLLYADLGADRTDAWAVTGAFDPRSGLLHVVNPAPAIFFSELVLDGSDAYHRDAPHLPWTLFDQPSGVSITPDVLLADAADIRQLLLGVTLAAASGTVVEDHSDEPLAYVIRVDLPELGALADDVGDPEMSRIARSLVGGSVARWANILIRVEVRPNGTIDRLVVQRTSPKEAEWTVLVTTPGGPRIQAPVPSERVGCGCGS